MTRLEWLVVVAIAAGLVWEFYLATQGLAGLPLHLLTGRP